jgi:hypothetical protein
MAVFQHPHLTRGVVITAKGAFVVTRGFVTAPEEVGDSLGWRRIDEDRMPAQTPMPSARPSSMRADAMAPLDRP